MYNLCRHPPGSSLNGPGVCGKGMGMLHIVGYVGGHLQRPLPVIDV
jgi:hypothetical protein